MPFEPPPPPARDSLLVKRPSSRRFQRYHIRPYPAVRALPALTLTYRPRFGLPNLYKPQLGLRINASDSSSLGTSSIFNPEDPGSNPTSPTFFLHVRW